MNRPLGTILRNTGYLIGARGMTVIRRALHTCGLSLGWSTIFWPPEAVVGLFPGPVGCHLPYDVPYAALSSVPGQREPGGLFSEFPAEATTRGSLHVG